MIRAIDVSVTQPFTFKDVYPTPPLVERVINQIGPDRVRFITSSGWAWSITYTIFYEAPEWEKPFVYNPRMSPPATYK